MSRVGSTWVATLLLCCMPEAAVPAALQTGNSITDLNSLVDPTAPFVSSQVTQPDSTLFSLISTFKVSSILIRPNKKVAVINSRQVEEGDSLGNAEVLSINKDSVTILIAGEERVLELYGRSVKTLNEGGK